MAYTNLSAAYHILDQNEKAVEYCEKGIKIFRLKGIRQGEGRSCLNLSSYYLHRGDYATALKYNEEALKTIRSLGYKAEEGDILLSQAKICNIFMQYERSMECCKEALSIKTAMADQPVKYQCYLAFGKTYNNLGQYRKAIHYANRSLKMGEELEFGHGAPLSIIGNALYYQGLFEESIEYFTKDLQICKATGDHCGEGDCYSNIGTAYFALGQIEKSVEYRKRALQIMKELGLRDGERWVKQSLGTSLVKRNNLPEAVQCFSESIRCHEEMRAHLADEDKFLLDDQNVSSYKSLCFLQIKLGKKHDALCIAEQGRARGLVDLLSAKYGTENASGWGALNLNAIKELVPNTKQICSTWQLS